MSRGALRRRTLAPALVLAVVTALLGAVTPPASAVVAVVTQSDGIAVGDPGLVASNFAAVTWAANVGPAATYPSAIAVTNGAMIADVDVQLLDVTSDRLDDLDVLLVGPGGQRVVLMSDVGGGTDVTAVDIVLNDEAASALPDDTVVASGSYQPTDVVEPALPDVYNGVPAGTVGTSLSAYDGLDPTGTWNLYAVDDTNGITQSFAGGWSLRLTLATTPYPSVLTVSGVPTVSDVDVTLHGVTTSFPDDDDLLLVAPGGRQATLMSDAGGGWSLAGAEITLDDEAATPLPDSGPIATGSYRPADYGIPADDDYPLPAPAVTGATALSVFDGIDPNGDWELYAVDDTGQFDTVVAGWSLDLTWTDAVAPSGSVTVASGVAVTARTDVTLQLSATDPAPGSGVSQMRFSNDGVTFSAYQPYAATAAWSLAPGSGTKTVYAQFRDADGNESLVVADTVVLDETGPRARRVRPAKNATGVAPGVKVKIKASESLDSATVSKRTAYLRKQGVPGKVAAKVSYDAARRTIVVDPVKRLDGRYTLTVSGARDLIGNRWDEKPGKAGAQALSYTFTTGG